MSPVFESLIRITLKTDDGERSFAGTLIAGAPRMVEIKDMELDAPFAPVMLYINNLDRPGFIGALGVLLGEAGVNIATFNLGRTASGGDAIALVGVDQAVGADVLAQVKALPQVKEVRLLTF
jgi:D-3-phosphoglycerate dehydrogenase